MAQTLKVNGKEVTVEAEPGTPLLWVLREKLGLLGTKFGCGQGMCGACTVHIDGAATRSCLMPVAAVSDMKYECPNLHVQTVAVDTGVPVGFWRSVGASHNAFYVESFIDELAHAAKQDPYKYRRARLEKSHPRFVKTLDTVARMANWETAPAAGRFRGIAIAESFGSIVAEVAEVSVSADGEPPSTRSGSRWIVAATSTPTRSSPRWRAVSSTACPPRCAGSSPCATGASSRATSTTTRCWRPTRCRRSPWRSSRAARPPVASESPARRPSPRP